jgi:hypothetical protein
VGGLYRDSPSTRPQVLLPKPHEGDRMHNLNVEHYTELTAATGVELEDHDETDDVEDQETELEEDDEDSEEDEVEGEDDDDDDI